MSSLGGGLKPGMTRFMASKRKNMGHDLDALDSGLRTSHDDDDYFTSHPSVFEWLRRQVPSRGALLSYAKSLFPCTTWIGHYNLHWLAGDVTAGITIGVLVVPQSVAYASLARLEPQFGLYSSFMGVIVHWLFGTSKDISIGPVAVLSSVIGSAVQNVISTSKEENVPPHIIASALSIMAGLIVLSIGLLRCGWIVDLISIPSLSAFMTGSAIIIVISQVPALLGLPTPSRREAAYKILIGCFRHLSHTALDAALGLTALAGLYLIRYGLNAAADRFPTRRRCLFANSMRTVFMISTCTGLSWLVNRRREGQPAFRLIGAVPKGLCGARVPRIRSELIPLLSSQLPAIIFVMLVEHIAISKSFGRLNNYNVDPFQEMVAIGVTNVFGSFLGAFPTTESFSRTAVNSKAGVRTPASGLFAELVILLAIYFLTAVFRFIPSAALSAVIIHAVGDLVTAPRTLHKFWKISPLEVVVFFVGVLVSVFVGIEDGLFATVIVSAAILLYRSLKTHGRFLGKVRAHSVVDDTVLGSDIDRHIPGCQVCGLPAENTIWVIYLPLDHADGSNPAIEIERPFPGIFMYLFSEGFNYISANFSLDYLTAYILSHTRPTSEVTNEKAGDKAWNNPGPRKACAEQTNTWADDSPSLKAIILDFNSVNHVDVTSMQRLIDVRNQLDVYTSPEVVDWHIACINNRWTRRALISAGFGAPQRDGEMYPKWKSIFSVAKAQGQDVPLERSDRTAPREFELTIQSPCAIDEESGDAARPSSSSGDEKGHVAKEKLANKREGQRRGKTMIHGLDRPLFHVDLTGALQSAIANVEARQRRPSCRSQPEGSSKTW